MQDSLISSQSAFVQGITSKGIFLKLVNNSIAFIAADQYRNPLTINLPGARLFFRSIQFRDEVQIAPNELIFPNHDFAVSIEHATVWSARNNETPIAELPHPSHASLYLARLNNAIQNPVDLFDHALAFLDGNLSRLPEELIKALIPLRQPATTSTLNLKESGLYFSGRGRGLTPSGDDLLLGWCYALKRLSAFHPLDLTTIFSIITGLIFQNSTLISANLVNAAAKGEVDERLLSAFEAMIGLSPIDTKNIENIIYWGSSSGVEAVAGMAIALDAVARLNNLKSQAIA